MKTIAFIHEVFPLGGAERVTINVATFLSRNNYKVFVLTKKFMEDQMPASEEELGFNVIHVPKHKGQKSEEYAAALAERIKSLRTDVAVFTCMFRRQPLVVKLAGVPCIHINHGQPLWEVDLPCFYTNNDESFWKIPRFYEYKRKNFKKRARICFRWFFYDRLRYKYLHTHVLKFKKRYRATLKAVSRYAVLCEGYKEETIRRLGISAKKDLCDKIIVLENSSEAVEKPNTDKEKNIVYVGRLSYMDKRIDRLLLVWERISAQLPEWTLTIVGEGEMRDELEKKAAVLPRVNLVGHQTNVVPFYQKASILCLTSTIESWGLCLMEAQTYGVVPIAFDCSAGVHTLLAPSGVNGILVPDGDIDGYAAQLLALANDGERLKEMRANVLKKAEDYSYEKMGKKWMAVIEELTR